MEDRLFVYNTLSRDKVEFVPISGRKVEMFVCGNTVYDDAHLGHAKTYIDFDMVARWIRHLGYNLKYVQNITDVDDKIIARANERHIPASTLSKQYEKRFLEDMSAIGCKESVDMFPRSHDYMPAIRRQIETLVNKGFAYYLDGDVYYDVEKFHNYTKLSGIKIAELAKHRIEPKPGKRHVYDFALWKSAKPNEPTWKIKIKTRSKIIELNGRPGWHIEDTAMTETIFGPQYDIHGGARELIFPHHTNEIAQEEAASGKKPMVRYWLHSGVLTVSGQKMSKSLKNFITIREFLSKHDHEVLRLLVASTHYRKDVDYNDSIVKDAEKKLRYMYAAFSIFYNLNCGENTREDLEVRAIVGSLKKDFSEAMNDDFNTPLALSKLIVSIGELRNLVEKNSKISNAVKQEAIDTVLNYSAILGLFKNESYKEAIPKEIYKLIQEREEYRKKANFKEADRIRDKIRQDYGIILEDTEFGTVWYKA